MGFMGKIKQFLVRWDLMPILLPLREDGFWNIAIPAALGLAGIFGKKKAADKQNEANLASQQAYNDWLQNRGGIDPNTGQLTGAAGQLVDRLTSAGFDPFGPQTSYRTGYDSMTGGGSERYNDRKTIGGINQRPGLAALENQVFGRLGTAEIPQSEQIRAVKQINDRYENAMQGLRDTLGIRGGGPTAALGASQGPTAQRASEIANYLGQVVPELTRKRQFENEQAAQSLLGQWQGQAGTRDYTNYSNQFGGSSQTGGPNMNFLANLLLPPSPQAPMTTGGTGWNALGDVGMAGANLASQYFMNKPQAQQPMTLPQGRNYDISNWKF